jgi:sporulation protein YlmC with PRC-barrel domain
MVKYIVAEQLLGKEVITSDGFYLGKFVDAEINEMTGKIDRVLVEPSGDSGLVSKLDLKDGMLQIPYNAILAVNDFIIADRKSLA